MALEFGPSFSEWVFGPSFSWLVVGLPILLGARFGPSFLWLGSPGVNPPFFWLRFATPSTGGRLALLVCPFPLELGLDLSAVLQNVGLGSFLELVGGPFFLVLCLARPSCGWVGPFLLRVGIGPSFLLWGPPFLLVVGDWHLLLGLERFLRWGWLWGFALPFWSGGLALPGGCSFCPPEWGVGPRVVVPRKKKKKMKMKK